MNLIQQFFPAVFLVVNELEFNGVKFVPGERFGNMTKDIGNDSVYALEEHFEERRYHAAKNGPMKGIEVSLTHYQIKQLSGIHIFLPSKTKVKLTKVAKYNDTESGITVGEAIKGTLARSVDWGDQIIVCSIPGTEDVIGDDTGRSWTTGVRGIRHMVNNLYTVITDTSIYLLEV